MDTLNDAPPCKPVEVETPGTPASLSEAALAIGLVPIKAYVINAAVAKQRSKGAERVAKFRAKQAAEAKPKKDEEKLGPILALNDEDVETLLVLIGEAKKRQLSINDTFIAIAENAYGKELAIAEAIEKMPWWKQWVLYFLGVPLEHNDIQDDE